MNKYRDALNRFDLDVSDQKIKERVEKILEKTPANENKAVRQLLYSCLDLTSLNTDDNKESIWTFVNAVNEFDDQRPEMDNVAAICVFPNHVADVKDALTADVKIASVAGGFPSAQTFIEVKIAEASLAVAAGADEIDIVLNCGEFFDRNYAEVSEEIQEMKEACRGALLKVILETGLLETATDIKTAAVLAMYSGADFIKTSTGKVYKGATPEAVLAMCDAIAEYHKLHGRKIGLKVSGGVRTTAHAIMYYTIVKETLGNEWLTPRYFRIGASALAADLLS